MTERYLVISSDCHAGLPYEEYRPYLDPEYRDAFDQSIERRKTVAAQSAMGNKEFEEKWFSENERGLGAGWAAARRDKELDADGVAGEVIFPDADAVLGGASAPFGAGLGSSSGLYSGDLMMAGARAHNRWVAELCQESPERRAGLALVPVHDIDAAVAEVTRAGESGLTGGALIPSMWLDNPPYHDKRYDPFWAACQDLEMPVHTHSGAAATKDYGTVVGFTGMYVTEVRFWSYRPLAFLIWSGVFERFPGLKYAVTECGCFWAADLLYMMDTTYERSFGGGSSKLNPSLGSNLSMRPSEYYDRNIKIGASNTRRRELSRRYEIGVGSIMWGNDFPHPEGTWPHTAESLRAAFWDMPVDETAQILGLNHAEFYGFDVDKLRPLADRIGPTPDDLGQKDPSVLSKWDDVRTAGRPWVTGVEVVPHAVG